MKKQILFMMFLSLAFVFAGVNNVFGQIDPNTNDPNILSGTGACVPAVPLTCLTNEGPLNPIPGKTYTYGIQEVGTTDVLNVTWFVYNATPTTATPAGYGPNIIVEDDITAALGNREVVGTSQFLLGADGHYGTPTPVPTTPYITDGAVPYTIDISWQSFDGSTNEILLVAYVEGAEGCSDNIEVYRIQPAFSFTLDIAGLMPDGTLNASGDPLVISNAYECVSPVWSATYDPSDPDYLTMDYGANYVFYTVTAANFVHSWLPTFTASHSGSSTVTEIAWAYPSDAASSTGTWNYADGTTGLYDPVTVQETDADAVGDVGECIVVRVLVEHNNIENDVASTVSLTVNGVMYDAAATDPDDYYANTTLEDLDEPASGTGPCVSDYTTDTAVYDLTPRPEITTDTEPGEDAGDQDEFVPKN